MIWPLIHKTPIRIQVNPIECGAVVLGIALEYYGHYFSAEYLNSIVQVSRHGTDAASLIRAALKLGLEATPQHAIVSDLKANKYLSILFVDNSHFVILEGYFRGYFYINDPALGRYRLRPEELRRRLSGVQIILKATAQLGQNKGQASKPLKSEPSLFHGGMMGLLLGLLLVIFASSLGLILDTGGLWLSFGFGLISFLLALCMLFFMSARLRLRRLSAKAYCHWLIHDIALVRPSFFETRPFLSFRATLKALNQLRGIGGRDPLTSATLIGIIIIIVIALGVMSWPLSIIALGLCLAQLSVGFCSPLKLNTFPPSSSWFDHYPDLAAMGQNQRIFNQQMAQALRAESKSKNSKARHLAYIPLGIALPVIFYVASRQIAAKELSVLEIFASLVLVMSLAYVASWLAMALRTRPGHERQAFLVEVQEQARLKPNLASPEPGILLKISGGAFCYPGQTKPVLFDFNLSLERSKIYSLVGGPLAGTTTLLKLLGQELAWSDQTQVLMAPDQRIALIDDETDLFDATLIDNIRLFDQTITEHEVVAALKQACAEELFYNRPMGLLAPIYAEGKNVSGGQKKRLLLARALVHQPDLILLDNFFETLELPLALKILANMRAKGPTIIFSTYRLLEQEFSDQVLNLGERL